MNSSRATGEISRKRTLPLSPTFHQKMMLLLVLGAACALKSLNCNAQSVPSASYQQFDNCSFADSVETTSVFVPTLTECLALSTVSPLTNAVAYCDATKTCNVMTTNNNEILVYLRVNVGWLAYVKDISTETRIVFKSQAGQSATQSVYGPFSKSDGTYTTQFTAAVASVNTSESCNCTYRNPFIDYWNVTQVTYQFVKAGLPVATVTFNGSGKNSTAWFLQRNIIGSAPFTMSTLRLRSFIRFQPRLPACSSSGKYREFLLWISPIGCNNDTYYMMATNENTACCYYSVSPYPRFIYSATLSEGSFANNGLLYADYLTILVNVVSRVVISP